ncbi:MULTISPECIES: hypothetical protein [Chryseobacterium]
MYSIRFLVYMFFLNFGRDDIFVESDALTGGAYNIMCWEYNLKKS